jgi:hypothetical protein
MSFLNNWKCFFFWKCFMLCKVGLIKKKMKKKKKKTLSNSFDDIKFHHDILMWSRGHWDVSSEPRRKYINWMLWWGQLCMQKQLWQVTNWEVLPTNGGDALTYIVVKLLLYIVVWEGNRRVSTIGYQCVNLVT